MGYSGGAIATNWASILAPDYAPPDINEDLIGAAQGGLLVNPANNLRYANGSIGWAGVVGMAVVGLARAYDIDFDPYLGDRGRELLPRIEDASIGNVILQYPGGVTWQDLAKPEYANPNSVPEYVDVANKINMGNAPIPTIPMFIAQAANGALEAPSQVDRASALATESWLPGGTSAHSPLAIATQVCPSSTTSTTPSVTFRVARCGSPPAPSPGSTTVSTEVSCRTTARTSHRAIPWRRKNTRRADKSNSRIRYRLPDRRCLRACRRFRGCSCSSEVGSDLSR